MFCCLLSYKLPLDRGTASLVLLPSVSSFQVFIYYSAWISEVTNLSETFNKKHKNQLPMTVPNVRQPNVDIGLRDQTSIALNLFNTILQTARNRTELEQSWAAIERDITIQEQREERQRQLRNWIWSSFLCFFVLKVLSYLDALMVCFRDLKHKLRINTTHDSFILPK